MTSNNSYWERKESHQCVVCGKQDERTLAGKIRCAECTERERKLRHMRTSVYERRKAGHECVRCGKQDARTLRGLTKCEKCTQKIKIAEFKRTENRIKDGICVRCGASSVALSGSGYCSACLQDKKEHDKKRAAYYKSTGRCPDCGRVPLPGKIYCEKCCAASAGVRRQRIEQGRCVSCGAVDARVMSGYQMCWECSQKCREYREANKEKLRKYSKERYDRLKAERRCIYCKKSLPDGWMHVGCPECNKKREQRQPVHESKWQDPDLCHVCRRAPKLDGYNVCAGCYESLRRRIASARQNIDRENHPWK